MQGTGNREQGPGNEESELGEKLSRSWDLRVSGFGELATAERSGQVGELAGFALCDMFFSFPMACVLAHSKNKEFKA